MENEFLIVKKKSKRKKLKRQNFCDSEFVVSYVSIDKNDLLRKVSDAKTTLNKSDYISKIISSVKNIFSEINYIICYGLGSIQDSYISRHQLAALLAFKEHFQCTACGYDPVFNPIEIEILEQLGIRVIKENDEGKRTLFTSGKTLVYFPHCSSQLVNNFLWANWNSSLHNCVVLSNSFTTVIERNDEPTVTTLSCLRDIIPITDECLIEDSYEVSDVFNDLSVHSFPIKAVTPEFWSQRSEPCYKGQVIEFCPKGAVIKHQLL